MEDESLKIHVPDSSSKLEFQNANIIWKKYKYLTAYNLLLIKINGLDNKHNDVNTTDDDKNSNASFEDSF